MNEINDITNLKANYGLVLRGDIFELKNFSKDIVQILRRYPDIKLIYRLFSASRLWVTEERSTLKEGMGK